MAAGDRDSFLTRVQPFFQTLFGRDAAGGSWLSPLLQATPRGRASLGELVDAPGWLQSQLAVRTPSGRLGCFDYPSAPGRALLRWFVDHPDELAWPDGAEMSAETELLRRALIRDEPAGSRLRAQDRARDVMVKRSALSRDWWRFEEISHLDCVLITERMVVTVIGRRTEPIAPATDWYPPRSELIRALEAARRLADGKVWASLVLSDEPLEGATGLESEAALRRATPHLDGAERGELRGAYLGNLTWRAACEAVGIEPDSLPDTTAQLGVAVP